MSGPRTLVVIRSVGVLVAIALTQAVAFTVGLSANGTMLLGLVLIGAAILLTT
jgi:hypothetical protein